MGDTIENVLYTDIHHGHALAVDLIAGIFGVRLQTQHQGHLRRYNGVWGCFTSIIREEKIHGLFKGMASPLVGVALINRCTTSLFISHLYSRVHDLYGSALRSVSKTPESPTIMDIFWAGCISGFVNGFFSSPMELVKIRLQNQDGAGKPLYSGPMDCVRKIYARQGIVGLYKGLGTTLIRETPSYGGWYIFFFSNPCAKTYFAAYELMTRMILPKDADPSQPSARLLFAGGMAGVVGWLSTYPVDVVKTRLQS
eukprot:jgi/Hompol1/2783/HPOL_006161-RA